MKNFRRLLSFVLPVWQPVLGVAGLGFATVAGNVALLFGAALLIARAALHPEVLVLMPLVGLVRLASLTRAGSRYLERYLSHDVTFRVLGQVQVWFYRALERLTPAQLWGYHSGELFSRLAGDVESLKDFYLRVISPPVTALLVLAGMFTFLAAFRLDLALTFAGFFLVAAAGVSLTAFFLNRPLGSRLVKERARLNIQLVDSLQGMREIVTFGQTERQLDRVSRVNGTYLNLQGRSASLYGLANALLGLMMNLAMLAVLVLAIARQLPGIYVGALALAALAGFEALLPLPGVFQYLEQNLVAAGRLFALTDLEPLISDPPNPPQPEGYDLQVAGLSFRYGPAEPWVLRNLGFTLPRGGRLALVGPSGAGKSTLVKILLRFADYEEGASRLGGHELKEYVPETLRRCLAVVNQKPYLFGATIRENLLLARPEATEEELVQVSRRAFIHDFIQTLPRGYDTYAGEGGVKLSGGQRQRLAISRALLKDAPVLILDEPTNGLDAPTAREVMTAVGDSLAGRSLLLITHHLVGLETMDEIIVLDQGEVVERGRHEDLLAGGGLYRRMWELQQQF
ncbi:MAG TPA: thiol reductant ABC exporter subunit CydC [Spirochaetia bacterium]|nr:thiol reductant ABC exporter subunit CydC [Spirochaetia bacterium]